MPAILFFHQSRYSGWQSCAHTHTHTQTQTHTQTHTHRHRHRHRHRHTHRHRHRHRHKTQTQTQDTDTDTHTHTRTHTHTHTRTHARTRTHTHTHLLKGPVLHLLRRISAGWTTVHLLLQSLVRTQNRFNVELGGGGGTWEGAVSSGCKEKNRQNGMKMPRNVWRPWGG